MTSQIFGKTTLRSHTEHNYTGVGLYARFAFAGSVCCAITHGALTPVDVVSITYFYNIFHLDHLFEEALI
jgi:solute carrier family 25 phosphate transporter 3